jgi:hypothetical protein
MALLFCDGFDSYLVTDASNGKDWDSWTDGRSVSTQVGPTLGRSSVSDSFTGGLYFPAFVNLVGAGGSVTKNVTTSTTLVIGCAVYTTAGPNSDTVVFRFIDSGSVQVDLRQTIAGYFYFTRNGTTIGGLSSVPLPFGAWHYLEVKVTIDGTAGTCEVKMDSVSILSLTGQNTKATSNSSANQVSICNFQVTNGSTPAYQFDDVYICNTSGSNNNNYLGDVRIRTMLPSGNSATQAWTATAAAFPISTAVAIGTTILDSNGNLQRVTAISGTGTTGSSAPTWSATTGVTTTSNPGGNQVVFTCLGTPSQYNYVNEPSPDNDYSYISSNNVGDKSQFTFPSIAGSTVFAVVVKPTAYKDDAGNRGIRAVAKTGTTTIDNGTDLMLSTTPTIQSGIFETDPSTGVAWTVSGVNAAEFGVKVSI